jgi:lysophospholipase L1-like esterase
MRYILFLIIQFFLVTSNIAAVKDSMILYKPNNLNIQYTGRIDFTNPLLPKFWQPGVQIAFNFSGDSCGIVLQDEILWGKNHNYVEVVLDDVATRIKLKSSRDTLWFTNSNKLNTHTLVIYKNTEANIGYLEFAGLLTNKLLAPTPKPNRKIEFIGNSITCGTGSDESVYPCGKGEWYDQHNAYLSYGSVVAKKLNAQFHLSSVSGIGLMHSCCGMKIIMPEMFDKINMYNGKKNWDFNLYQPDIVSICIGQNDGIQDSSIFINNYLSFLKKLRTVYPDSYFILITSPMADYDLGKNMSNNNNAIVSILNNLGEQKIASYAFSKQYNAGCDGHPSLAQHALIADELTNFINKQFNWLN